MLRGLLMRRQSSQPASTASTPNPNQSVTFDEESSVVVSEPLIMSETTYGGDMSGDMGGEVRFSVELTRLDRLTDTYSLDVRRLNGNLNSYKYLYETFRQCVCFLSVWAVADVLFSPQTYRFTAVEGWSRNFSLSLSHCLFCVLFFPSSILPFISHLYILAPYPNCDLFFLSFLLSFETLPQMG